MQIFKYPLSVTANQVIKMPIHARILSIAVQNGIPTLWAKVHPSKEEEDVTIEMIATGEDFSPCERREFLGTVLIKGSIEAQLWGVSNDQEIHVFKRIV